MRFVGIDVAAERHVVAVVDETDRVVLKATPFTEDADGYARLLGVLGAPTDALVAMEATGHYWKNLFAALVAAGFAVACNSTSTRKRQLTRRRGWSRTCVGSRLLPASASSTTGRACPSPIPHPTVSAASESRAPRA
jgi:transposase